MIWVNVGGLHKFKSTAIRFKLKNPLMLVALKGFIFYFAVFNLAGKRQWRLGFVLEP